MLGLPELCGLAWSQVHLEQEPCSNSKKDVLGTINTLSVHLPPPLPFTARALADTSQFVSLHNIMWAGNMDQTPISSPPSPYSAPQSHPYPPARASYTWTSLAQQKRLRWKEEKDSLLDKCASSTKSRKKKIDPDGIRQPHSSPWPKPRAKRKAVKKGSP